MKIKLHIENLHPNLDGLRFLVDVLMILLVLANLGLILFDWLYQVGFIEQGLQRWTPLFHAFYRDQIHANFSTIDLAFVSVYLAEFVISWTVAACRRTYYRWFFYPFIHWYDLLGCIPVGSFRWLRILRLVSIGYRLQRLGVVDFSQTLPGRMVASGYDVLAEEISDRVVIKVLQGAQREIRSGGQMMQRIESEVLAPRRDQLVDYLVERIIEVARRSHDQYRAPLSDYLLHVTDEAIRRTAAGRKLAAIPVAGPAAIALLGETVRDAGTVLVDQIVADVTSPAHREQLDTLIDSLFSAGHGGRRQLNQLVRETLVEVLDQVQAQVSVQHWKQNDNQS